MNPQNSAQVADPTLSQYYIVCLYEFQWLAVNNVYVVGYCVIILMLNIVATVLTFTGLMSECMVLVLAF